jgi:NAD-dependent dihydropyrimidine dehydrogenase PreA subunit
MATKKLTVVISQAQGKNPAKQQLEEDLAMSLMLESAVECSVVPHLYDMSRDHSGMLFLQSVPGDVVVLSWLYPRGARWTLDRAGVKGHEGESLLISEDDQADDESDEQEEKESQAIGALKVPNRKIYCIDLRVSLDTRDYLDEIRRIADESTVETVDLMQWVGGSPQKEQLERYLHPVELIQASKGNNGNGHDNDNGNGASAVAPEPTKRRWYPVIDYSRCTNCMECIDFCLFGVYGVDGLDRILVEEQDSCKKGCPACSRVCPENAIIFPAHKTSAIAGADGDVAGLKIDLSKLFGAPEKSALDMAVSERDAELVADGRDAVGLEVGIPKRQTSVATAERDALDDLMDGLDEMDL